jgi:branched-chain amino acid aminotransferase
MKRVFEKKNMIRNLRFLSSLRAADLTIKLNPSPKSIPPNKELVFGHTFTDHMLTIDWDAKNGWSKPSIVPYGKLELDPSCTVFHYGIECFEGMKAYKDGEGKIRLFRPDMNMSRFLKSCERLMLPSFDKGELLECIKQFTKVDSRWIPSERGIETELSN